MLKIATFNVNSVKARLPRLLEWLRTSNPDIVCLQELKCVESEFPFEALFDVGYNAVVSGQKSYNGVAILSKFKIEDGRVVEFQSSQTGMEVNRAATLNAINQSLLNDDKKTFEKTTPRSLHVMYAELKQKLEQSISENVEIEEEIEILTFEQFKQFYTK